MHYKIEGLDSDLEELSKYAKEMGMNTVTAQDKFNLKSSDLPEGTKIVVLSLQKQS